MVLFLVFLFIFNASWKVLCSNNWPYWLTQRHWAFFTPYLVCSSLKDSLVHELFFFLPTLIFHHNTEVWFVLYFIVFLLVCSTSFHSLVFFVNCSLAFCCFCCFCQTFSGAFPGESSKLIITKSYFSSWPSDMYMYISYLPPITKW